MSVTVKLTKPIKAHGEMLKELTLREPRGRDIAQCGEPRTIGRVGNRTTIEFNTEAIHGYIVNLAGIPPSSADQLSAADWMSVANAVTGFFDQRAAASSAAAEDEAPEESEQPTDRIKMPFQDTTT